MFHLKTLSKMAKDTEYYLKNPMAFVDSPKVSSAIEFLLGFIPPKEDNFLGVYSKLMNDLWQNRHGSDTVEAVLKVIEDLKITNRAGAPPKLFKQEQTEYGWFLMFAMPHGCAAEAVIEKLNHFEQQCKGTVRFDIDGPFLKMRIMTVSMPKEIEYAFDGLAYPKMFMPFPVGMLETGHKLLVLDLADFPHMLVAGTPGSGKSAFLRQLTYSLIPQPRVFVCVIDLKRLDFNHLKRHCWVASEIHEAEQMLRMFEAEHERRTHILAKHDCTRLHEYYLDHGKTDIPWMVLIIDELRELEQSKKAQKSLTRLSSLSRADGISIIAAVQRPTATVWSNNKSFSFTDFRANLLARICFRTADDSESRLVLNNPAASRLNNPGKAVWQFEGQEMVQTMFLDVKKAIQWLGTIPPKRKGFESSAPASLIRKP